MTESFVEEVAKWLYKFKSGCDDDTYPTWSDIPERVKEEYRAKARSLQDILKAHYVQEVRSEAD